MKIFSLLTHYKWMTLIIVLYSGYIQCRPYEKLFKPHHEQPRSSIKGIDGIYVINLDVRPEKWHRLEPILYYYGVDNTRFSAIFGWDYDELTLRQFCTKNLGIGHLGCLISHLSIYQDALKRKLKVIWVLEDDAEILRNPAILSDILEELNSIDPQWDILYTDLGSSSSSFSGFYNKKQLSNPLEYFSYRENISKRIQLLRFRFGTFSMIVSERGIKKVLAYFKSRKENVFAYDVELHFIPEIREYGIIKPVATHLKVFNISDTDTFFFRNFYEISDEHVKYLNERYNFVVNIIKKTFCFSRNN